MAEAVDGQASEGRAAGRRIAIVLMNLGGPDNPDAVRPFLFNLFNDPAIIRLPAILRRPLAWFIARRRAPVAREIYGRIGGRSPILPLTEEQAAALQQELNAGGDDGQDAVRCFVAMRYWHPRASATVAAVQDWGADRVLLLPLYPQFSTTTSASSIAEWRREAARAGLRVPTRALCCYPELPGFIAAQAEMTMEQVRAIDDAAGSVSRTAASGPSGVASTSTPHVRILFSAHGLPKRIVAAGDPYQYQVEATAAALAEAIGDGLSDRGALDWSVCYQSRVGPLEWIGPSTDAEIERAGRDGVALVVVPIAFVSEHSETLVELDIEYAELARRCGVPAYRRVPAVGTAASFIDSLAGLAASELELFGDQAAGDGSSEGRPEDRSGGSSGGIGRAAGRFCPMDASGCPCGRQLSG